MLDLSRERWQRLDDLLAEALDRDPDERTAFLRAACGADPDLYRAAAALVERAARAEHDLGESVTGFAAPMLDAQAEPPLELDAGTTVGPYRIVGEIGRGGMGAVYLAERADGTFEKQVALKLVKRGMDTDEVLARFRRERQILAGLDHPGIARLLDAGATDDGRPYLVMEVVEGEPVTAWAEARSLDLTARLALIEQVCEAVAYAHRRLVIHRDLKPSNILVADDETGQPQVKLLDFGIARLLDPETGDTLTQTTGPRLLTPAYAAPEQLRGEAVSTATDVYALGVVLYEMLTGQRPPDPLKPPSTVMESESGRRLRGDLDTICLKALRENPEERYPSVEALLDDLQRSRTGLPVQARPASATYRMRKFVERHRVGVAATALVVLSLIGGLSAALWQARAKTLEANRAEAVKALVLDLFAQADPEVAQGEVLTALDLAVQGAERVRTTLGDQPEVQAEMLVVLGEVYRNLGQYDDAVPLLDEALALRRARWGNEHEQTAEVLDLLGEVQMERADYDAADAYLTEALRIRRARLGEEHNDVAETLTHLGTLRGGGRQGRVDEAAAFHQQSFDIRQRILDEDDPDLLRSMRGLTSVLFDAGDYAAAEPLLRDLLQRQRRMLGNRHPETLRTMIMLMRTLGNLMQRLDNAVALGREAIPLAREVWGEDHSDTADIIQAVAAVLINRSREEDFDEVEALEREALAIRRATLGDEHPIVAESLASLSLILKGMGRTSEAVESAQEAVALERRTRGSETRGMVIYQDYLAKAQYESNALDEADRTFTEAYEIGRRTWPADHLILADILVHHGQLLQEQGRTGEAEPILREGLRIAALHLPPTHDMLGTAKLRIGLCLVAQRQFEAAEALLLDALAIYEVSEPEAGVPLAHEALADLYDTWGQSEKAQAYR